MSKNKFVSQISEKIKANNIFKIMGRTKDLFMRLREEDDFLKEHIIICTLEPEGTVTTAPNNKE